VRVILFAAANTTFFPSIPRNSRCPTNLFWDLLHPILPTSLKNYCK